MDKAFECVVLFFRLFALFSFHPPGSSFLSKSSRALMRFCQDREKRSRKGKGKPIRRDETIPDSSPEKVGVVLLQLGVPSRDVPGANLRVAMATVAFSLPPPRGVYVHNFVWRTQPMSPPFGKLRRPSMGIAVKEGALRYGQCLFRGLLPHWQPRLL
ncbi:hypothetical protein CDAR_168861 [Caerostris darwini]|uniref:Secreted protein n=1 Tax=Caerostris darwini TaxID=1538125 RepID=A0AAV4WQK6_9ARAC|nr:hypothetical protein CDAR_168861 [Caerostris darwini]